jgi:hypothetical protein
VDENKLKEIKAVAEGLPGPSGLLIFFETSGRRSYTVKAGPRYGVEPGEAVIQGLEEIVGKGNVELR